MPPGTRRMDEPKKPSFPAFLDQVDNRQIKTVEMRQKDNTLEVTKRDGGKYEIGFVDEYGDEGL